MTDRIDNGGELEMLRYILNFQIIKNDKNPTKR